MKKNFKSSILSNHYIVFDTETISRSPWDTEICELSAICVDCHTLEKKDVVFNQLVLPPDLSKIEPEAMKVNNISIEELKKKGKPQEVVLKEFINYCRQFQKTNKIWDNLIPVTYNGTNFDKILMDRWCFKYNHLENGRPRLFHPMHEFDVFSILRLWYHASDELPSYKLTDIAEYMGLPTNNAHRALADCENTYLIFRRLMEFQRKLSSIHTKKFYKCFSKDNNELSNS